MDGLPGDRGRNHAEQVLLSLRSGTIQSVRTPAASATDAVPMGWSMSAMIGDMDQALALEQRLSVPGYRTAGIPRAERSAQHSDNRRTSPPRGICSPS